MIPNAFFNSHTWSFESSLLLQIVFAAVVFCHPLLWWWTIKLSRLQFQSGLMSSHSFSTPIWNEEQTIPPWKMGIMARMCWVLMQSARILCLWSSRELDKREWAQALDWDGMGWDGMWWDGQMGAVRWAQGALRLLQGKNAMATKNKCCFVVDWCWFFRFKMRLSLWDSPFKTVRTTEKKESRRNVIMKSFGWGKRRQRTRDRWIEHVANLTTQWHLGMKKENEKPSSFSSVWFQHWNQQHFTNKNHDDRLCNSHEVLCIIQFRNVFSFSFLCRCALTAEKMNIFNRARFAVFQGPIPAVKPAWREPLIFSCISVSPACELSKKKPKNQKMKKWSRISGWRSSSFAHWLGVVGSWCDSTAQRPLTLWDVATLRWQANAQFHAKWWKTKRKLKRRVAAPNKGDVKICLIRDGIPWVRQTTSESGPLIPSEKEHASIEWVEKEFGSASEPVWEVVKKSHPGFSQIQAFSSARQKMMSLGWWRVSCTWMCLPWDSMVKLRFIPRSEPSTPGQTSGQWQLGAFLLALSKSRNLTPQEAQKRCHIQMFLVNFLISWSICQTITGSHRVSGCLQIHTNLFESAWKRILRAKDLNTLMLPGGTSVSAWMQQVNHVPLHLIWAMWRRREALTMVGWLGHVLILQRSFQIDPFNWEELFHLLGDSGFFKTAFCKDAECFPTMNELGGDRQTAKWHESCGNGILKDDNLEQNVKPASGSSRIQVMKWMLHCWESHCAKTEPLPPSTKNGTIWVHCTMPLSLMSQGTQKWRSHIPRSPSCAIWLAPHHVNADWDLLSVERVALQRTRVGPDQSAANSCRLPRKHVVKFDKPTDPDQMIFSMVTHDHLNLPSFFKSFSPQCHFAICVCGGGPLNFPASNFNLVDCDHTICKNRHDNPSKTKMGIAQQTKWTNMQFLKHLSLCSIRIAWWLKTSVFGLLG